MIPSCVVSVSLRSYIHSYLLWILRGTKAQEEFPSPYGVSFILMSEMIDNSRKKNAKFPSPYGVSFILILDLVTATVNLLLLVSVSLRSIIHSYGIKNLQ